MSYDFTNCTLCPRACGVDRTERAGYCGATARMRIARAALHAWEEPCISGTRGSGTVFFTGCPLHCVFCQNHEISCGGVGREIDADELADLFLDLQSQGAHNINLVSPTQYAPLIARALRCVRGKLEIPVVYNTGGYERVETLRLFEGLVDVYLPDLKFRESETARRYAHAPDYFDHAMKAIGEMVRQVGAPVFSGDGLLTRGVLVRHLVLPGKRREGEEIIRALAANFAPRQILVSVMGQYTPVPGVPAELDRKVTTFEVSRVADVAVACGFDGYTQERGSADSRYIPPFEL